MTSINDLQSAILVVIDQHSIKTSSLSNISSHLIKMSTLRRISMELDELVKMDLVQYVRRGVCKLTNKAEILKGEWIKACKSLHLITKTCDACEDQDHDSFHNESDKEADLTLEMHIEKFKHEHNITYSIARYKNFMNRMSKNKMK
jgi:hypothetical protein